MARRFVAGTADQRRLTTLIVKVAEWPQCVVFGRPLDLTKRPNTTDLNLGIFTHIDGQYLG